MGKATEVWHSLLEPSSSSSSSEPVKVTIPESPASSAVALKAAFASDTASADSNLVVDVYVKNEAAAAGSESESEDPDLPLSALVVELSSDGYGLEWTAENGEAVVLRPGQAWKKRFQFRPRREDVGKKLRVREIGHN